MERKALVVQEEIECLDTDFTYDDDSDKDSQIPYEIPNEVRKITTQAYDKSVSDIVRMMEEGDIRLDPDYQRNYVWDNKKSSLLIESIILNVPIPVIYVSQEKDDTWSVIDGLQRLYSLKRFFDGKFKLSGLEVLSELNRQDIHTLNFKALRMLRNGLLRVIMITHDSNEEIKYDVFMRLNTGSVHLTEQELRNCLYRGALNKLLKDLSANKTWQKLLGLVGPHKRMADRELALRFLAISQSWNDAEQMLIGYKGRMKSFLNVFMKKYQDVDHDTISHWKSIFEDTVEKVYGIYGEDAFRRTGKNGVKEKSINRAIMDVLMLSSISYNYDELLNRKEKILSKLIDLISTDTTFYNSIKIGTSDTKVVAYRLSRWCSELKTIVSSN